METSAAVARDARFWNRAARRYSRARISDEAGWERSLARASALLEPHYSVLEIGCGTGTAALRLGPKVKRYLATDISAEMIAIAREKAGGEEHPAFMVAHADADPARLGASEGGFDAVIAFNLLHLVPDRAATLAHIRTLLKPGCLLITKTPCLAEMNSAIRLLVPLMRAMGKAPASVAFFDAATLVADMQSAGFTIEEEDRHGSKPKEPRLFLAARKS